MKRWHGLLIVAVVSLGMKDATASGPVWAQEKPSSGAAVHSEFGLRLLAIGKTMPTFPSEVARRGVRGVAVARIRTTIEGRMDRVEILQAPDAALGDAVRAALMQWTFQPSRGRPAPNGQPYVAEGKVTFYFEVRNGRGVVLNPDQVEGNTDVWEADKAALQPRAGGPAIVRPSIANIPEIDVPEMKQRLAKGLAVLVDVRNRDDFARAHTAGALNIPGDEIAVRARAELDRRVPVIVDCSQGDQLWCRRVGAVDFRSRGFDVSLLVP